MSKVIIMGMTFDEGSGAAQIKPISELPSE